MKTFKISFALLFLFLLLSCSADTIEENNNLPNPTNVDTGGNGQNISNGSK